jgi:hypothetical protein
MRNSVAAALLALLALSPVEGLAAPLPAQEDREAVRRAYEAVRPSMIAVDLVLKKKTRLEKADLDEESLDAEAQRQMNLAEQELPLETWGVAVAKDLIVMADRGLRPGDVEKIECVDAKGNRFEATMISVLANHDGVLLKPAAGRELVPLAFEGEPSPFPLGSTFHATYADRADGRWQLNVSPYIMTNAPLVDGKDWHCIDAIRPGSVIGDAKGNPVGVALDQNLWILADGRSSFPGKALLADERIDDLEARAARIRQALPASVKRVEISLRADRAQDRYAPADDGRAGRLTVFGVAVDDKGTLLVPESLTRDQVRKIEDLSVNDGGKLIPATFLGSFKAFAGFLVRAEGLKAPSALALDAKPPAPGRILLAASFDDRFGASRIRIRANRLFRTERGIGGADRLRPRSRIGTGSFLLDLDGRIGGFATLDRKEEDLDELALEGSDRSGYGRYRPSYTPEHLRRLVYGSEIAGLLANPAPHFDPKAVPMTKRDEKRLVWLGVEYQEFSKPLAEALKVQDRELTNDGRRGLLVTELYADSPAARAGMKLDDVLLSVKEEGGEARDLAAEPDRYGGMRGRYDPRGGPAAPWKPTKNYLTALLTEIGAGKKAAFEVLRGGKKQTIALALEQAPLDFETAERHKDDTLGITVKELTYEVRHFQRLEPGTTGVVVTRVESGSRADIGKLQVLSIVVRVNGIAVNDLAHFQELLQAHKSLTLTTVSYGQTRLVELSRE